VQAQESRNHNYYDDDADDVEDIHRVLQLRREFPKERRLNRQHFGQEQVPASAEFILPDDGVIRIKTDRAERGSIYTDWRPHHETRECAMLHRLNLALTSLMLDR
jgi:hypothetical protein